MSFSIVMAASVRLQVKPHKCNTCNTNSEKLIWLAKRPALGDCPRPARNPIRQLRPLVNYCPTILLVNTAHRIPHDRRRIGLFFFSSIIPYMPAITRHNAPANMPATIGAYVTAAKLLLQSRFDKLFTRELFPCIISYANQIVFLSTLVIRSY